VTIRAHRRVNASRIAVIIAPSGGVTLSAVFVCIANRSKITHEATARSPIVCETSKHSIRCASAEGQALPAARRAGPPVSPLREFLPDRELRVLVAAGQPDATLATGFPTISTRWPA
jgi:hypothetical protein